MGLIGLQAIWLFSVYKYKQQELIDKTREAVLKTTERLQQEEDSKLILENMDSLLVTDNIIGKEKKENIRVIVSSIKNKLKFDTFTWEGNTKVDRKVEIVNDSATTTTIAKLNSGKNKKVIVSSESFNNDEVKEKANELEALFIKMAVKSTKGVQERIDFKKIQNILKEELLLRGVDISPEIGIAVSPKFVLKGHYMVFETPGFMGDFPLSVILPLFPDDGFHDKTYIDVGFVSTTNFVIKQMTSLLSLSLFITILIGFVMIYLFRRMLSQEKLHQLKNDFINNMTHELKTPIATISLAIDGINNPAIKNDETKFNNYTSILKEENKKLNNHVERVLQMAMLDKGELVLEKNMVNLKFLLENCINSYQLQIQNKKTKVILNITEEVNINGDEFHLMNAFANLLDNALKYSGENCEITITLNNNGEISFKDNGIGIDKAIQEKIFEKFYRAQGGNLHDVKGFGLGLSYVKSIIEAHNGTIELISEINKGSEFIIKLNAN